MAKSTSKFGVQVNGLDKLNKKFEQVTTDLTGNELKSAIKASTLIVQREAMLLAPVDRGQLKASITSQIQVDGKTVKGLVGTAKKHGLWMEFGTKPHFPPREAIELWAKRHKVNWFVVAKAIAKKGTKPRSWLQKAFNNTKMQVRETIKNGIDRIVTK